MSNPAEALSRKKKIRAGHRASTTRMLGQITTALEGTPDRDRLTLLKLTLNEKLDTLNRLDSEIIELTADEHLDNEIQQSDEYKERIYSALTRVDKVLNTTAAHTTSTPPTVVPDRGTKVKLPKLTLPHFSGNLMKWAPFWDSYESAVHNNRELSDVDKFNHLRALLEHPAADAISGLALTAANYKEAIEILHKRFGNKQMIVAKHMETLLSAEAVSSDHHLKELRRLYDTTESHIRSLKSLGVEATSYGSMLSSVLLAKLPPDLRLIVSRRVSSSDEMKMEDLLCLFEEELVARERAAGSNPTSARTQGRRSQERGQHSALLSEAKESGARMVCCYCQRQHPSRECTVVLDVNARKQILKGSGRCFNCLRKGHIGRTCRSSSNCQRCHGRHHTSICESPSQTNRPTNGVPRLVQSSQPGTTRLNPDAALYTPDTTTSTLCSGQRKTILLQTARGIVQNPRKPWKFIELRLLMDSGSQKSYLTARAKKLLELEPAAEQLMTIATFGSEREKTQVCPVVDVRMCLKGYPPISLSLYVVPTICQPLVCQPISACVQHSKAFLGLDLADHSDGEGSLQVDLLIGSDYYWDLVTGSVCKIEGGPTAVHTKLGWVLSGPTLAEGSVSCSTNLNTTHVLRVEAQSVEAERLDEQLRSFWELESLGIQEREKTLYDDFATRIVFRGGRYQVPLPWKEFHEPLPDNYQLSLKRLQGLLRRLKQDPEILQEYNRTIEDQLAKGIIEAVPEVESQPVRAHYLPHHAVVRRDKATTKLRVVYDASAKSTGRSLNECLNKGPKFHQLILDLLLRFRSYRIALTADVEKAFLMIAIDDKDRDVLRFIWVDDITSDDPKLQIYRFTRVVFGVSSSPFLLNATIKYHLEGFMGSHRAIVERLLQSIYVDDIVSGADSEDEAFELYAQAKELFGHGGFNLRKFLTSSKELQQRIDQAEEMSKQVTSSDPSTETYTQTVLGTQSPKGPDECKILGLLWNPSSDCLVFDISELAQVAVNLQPTKRNLVSLIGKFYDPLGFLTPITVRFKILFQKMCRDKIDWDTTLPSNLIHEWQELVTDLNEGRPISVPRSFLHRIDEDPAGLTLCGFCDASIQAYAAVVYLMLKTSSGVAVRFVVSKTRVAPLQLQSIPRLELLSAFLLAKLMISVVDSLKSTLPQVDVRCFTDSQVALCWIRGTKKEWKPFVQNRVDEIRRNVHPSQWSHCPGRSNPADVPSRGCSALEVSVNQLWRRGPEWLSTGIVEPCVEIELPPMPEECIVELKTKPTQSLTLVNTVFKSAVSGLIDCKRFSTLSTLLRVTAQVLRAVELFKSRKNKQNNNQSNTVTLAQLIEAELLWVKDAQQPMSQKSDFKTHRKQFNLFEDEKGLWRCRGRLANAEVPYAVKNPILLPRGHPLTFLIVREAHERVFHDGIRETLTEIRRKFWIPKVRSLTRQLIHQCVLCRKFEGSSFKPPPPPPLPTFRVKEDPAFTYTGVDFAGPLYVRGYKDLPQKVWICLFTCYVTRAVHLEVVADQSTETFLRCLKKFSARRGLPAKFLSDNGKTFKAAAKYLKAVFKDGTVKEYLRGLGTDWKFNVERAPWWGGAFERMVRSTKRCLRKLIGRAQYSLDELVTALAEIEAVINSRPLTYVSADDMEEPLTPSHLIMGRRIRNLPDHLSHLDDIEDEEFSPDSAQLTRRMKHLSSTLNHFWNRWRSEYLSELREVHSYMARRQGKTHSKVSVGDVVIVHNEHLPRGLWKLGKIKTVMRGGDGHIRGATVKTTTSDGRSILLNRPVQLLYPLEVQDQELISEEEPNEEDPVDVPDGISEVPTPPDKESEPDSKKTTRRSQRVAAQIADARRKAGVFELEDD